MLVIYQESLHDAQSTKCESVETDEELHDTEP